MSNENITSLSVNSVVESLSAIYIRAIKNGVPFSKIPAPFLWGPPGAGKSNAIREIAECIEQETGKTVRVTDLRLLLFSPIDLRGVPMADSTRQFTEWLRPKIFDLSANEDVINILFLDELSACPPSLQAAAYQITLDRTMGEHKLPENTIVIAAGNRTTDRSVAYRMPEALANRMMHFNVEISFESWKKWAIRSGIHPFVIGYLSYDNSKISVTGKDNADLAFPTPRSWEFVSNLLHALGIKSSDALPQEAFNPISGCIGCGLALEFNAWCIIYKELPPVENIFIGEDVPYPKKQDILYAMISSMIAFITDRLKDSSIEGLSVTELENACRYALKFPSDYAASFFYSLLELDKLKLTLMKVPSFQIWLGKNKQYIP